MKLVFACQITDLLRMDKWMGSVHRQDVKDAPEEAKRWRCLQVYPKR